ncbi:phosphoribosylformylglycinamidine synthase subunit PurL [Stratiformator vulcanicus]|uniref:Phosphoribosylformylglycinamidine synthase subunit PurL n=1 Tax=Stratiformator vulcanicus TaxID=2527980 RepID=A0A517R2N5_9PLAN|nr:phosphoribosylformylglycinamidine synthase subunit PurL [Stratiformator vulcanicus]QDT38150.1 Phosphoribosylformylglycinamidine synthase subunit PurL [Stratiformator vulcanicus]
MLWEIEIRPRDGEPDREAQRVLTSARRIGIDTLPPVAASRSFLIEGGEDESRVRTDIAARLTDPVVEQFELRALPDDGSSKGNGSGTLMTVLPRPGVTDNVGSSSRQMFRASGLDVDAVAAGRKYRFDGDVPQAAIDRLASKVLANDAIERVFFGPLQLDSIALGSPYQFELVKLTLGTLSDEELLALSRNMQLSLSLDEMRTIQAHYRELDREPTDCELETIAQTWSEHCSHKTLAGRIRYREQVGEQTREVSFDNMLKETIFAATQQIRRDLGSEDWCVSVFKDNAGIVKFHDTLNVSFKVETHNRPSALEPYGGANTGIGGVIRDSLGTGLGGRPVCNTDVFCFAPPEIAADALPKGVLHPRAIMEGVVSGVRDYGNRMGIPTVNGAVLFDERFIGNPLVFCGNVATIPVDKCEKKVSPGDLIVTVGGRTGKDGIHGATFSSAELTEESEVVSGGAVQIGDAVTEKMVADVVLAARDRNLYSAITDCGAGGFSSAVGEMGEETGAQVDLEKAPLKYEGLSYTEIWISEAQERMVLSVPPSNWEEFRDLCASEGVEATAIGEFTDTGRLVLNYDGNEVCDLSMTFLHDGRPPVIREATFTQPKFPQLNLPSKDRYDSDLKAILGSLDVCSKEWVIRQYDHEVQSGSVIKPLVGIQEDGPSDAAVVRPDLNSSRGIVVSCGITSGLGDFDAGIMAANAIDEAIRNAVAVGADPSRIAILDNFCWGNCERPETLGALVRAALACQEAAVAFKAPFISGKDSLNNEFSYIDADGIRQTVIIPHTLLISAIGQINDVSAAVTMDLKSAGNAIYLVGETKTELGGSHYFKVNQIEGGAPPEVDLERAPKVFAAVHEAIHTGTVRSCHDLSEGGLAAAAAEMAFAGGLGIELTFPDGVDPTALLFAESPTRFLIEVRASKAEEFETRFAGLPCVRLGEVTGSSSVRVTDAEGRVRINSPLEELKEAWQGPLSW